MYNLLLNTNPLYQALLAGLFTWFITVLGASIVFFFKKVDNKIMNPGLGLSAGIMLAASIFSLIIPALEMNKRYNYLKVSLGIIIGMIFIIIGELIYKRINKSKKEKNCFILILSIIMHNIPEGLIIGLSYASHISLSSSLMLTLGIGIQNFPEGSAISLPLRREGYSRTKAFIVGALSAIVEPIAAVTGAFLAIKLKVYFPYLLSIAAGAMFYVIIEELIPESQTSNKMVSTITTIIGFIIMMILDISLS